MAGNDPSAFRAAAIILAAVAPLGAVVPTPEIFWLSLELSHDAQAPVQVMEAGLLLLVKPQLPGTAAYLLSVAYRSLRMWTAETLLPPNLKPLPLLALPPVVFDWDIAQQLSTVIGESQP